MAVERYPNRVAIDGSSGAIAYAGLWRIICRLADMIAAHADRPGIVGIMLPANAAYAAAVFACLAAHRTCVLLDAGYPADRNAEIAAATGIGLMLTDSSFGVAWPGTAHLDVMPAFDEARPVPCLSPASLDQDAPAFILCTSGSTGRPKAIVHSQRTMLQWVRSSTNAMHIGPEDRVLSVSSPASLGGFSALLTFPLAGAAMQMTDVMTGGFRALMETLSTRPVTILRAAPSLLRNLARLPDAGEALSGLRVVQTYGEPLLKADVNLLIPCLKPSCLIRSTYGATESSGLAWFAGEPDDHDPARVAAGTLLPDTAAMIVGENGNVCGTGEAGELLIRSRYNALGEWLDGELVPGRLVPDAADPLSRVYHTGDMARRSADGVFVVLGRKDRMIKVNGQRAEPAEIEAALRQMPEVLQAAVVARQTSDSTLLLAFVVPRPEAGPDLAAELRMKLRSLLPSFMLPSRILLRESLPLLPGGKVDEAALLAKASE